MPHALALNASSFFLIWFSMLLALVVLLLSQAKEYHTEKRFRHAFIFALAVLVLCTMIALQTIQ